MQTDDILFFLDNKIRSEELKFHALDGCIERNWYECAVRKAHFNKIFYFHAKSHRVCIANVCEYLVCTSFRMLSTLF